MIDWRSRFDFSRPFWDDFQGALQQLTGPRFPSADELCDLLPDGLKNHGGKVIRFVAAGQLSDSDYEQRIYTTGEVSTREESWHDLFNALVWSRFPNLKVAMNTTHVREQKLQQGRGRGMQRDALTLLDESGALVIGSDESLLEALAFRDWPRVFQAGVFQHGRAHVRGDLNLFLCGHALLEKFLQPYKAITAQVLILRLGQEEFLQSRESLRLSLDQVLADALLEGRLFSRPADLSPLPLMGIPGWWAGVQDGDYYADDSVFRPPRKGLEPTPVFQL